MESPLKSSPAAQDNIDQMPSWREVFLSLELMPAALADLPTIVIALIAFLVITMVQVDVAKVALGAMTSGVLFAVAKGLWPSL